VVQETRRYKPSTVSRRTSVLAGFYPTCVIDGVLEHSPAEYVRRPTVPAESPTLGVGFGPPAQENRRFELMVQ
jgi:integrase/recombinase XerD